MDKNKKTRLPWVMIVSLVLYSAACIWMLCLFLNGLYILTVPSSLAEHSRVNPDIGPQLFSSVVVLFPVVTFNIVMTMIWGAQMLLRKAAFRVVYAVHSGLVGAVLLLYGAMTLKYLSAGSTLSEILVIIFCFSVVLFLAATSVYAFKSNKMQKYLYKS